MPILPGSDLTDASGSGLVDSVLAVLGEAALDFGEILQKLTTINASVLGLPTVLDYEWLADRLAEWLGTDRVTLGNAVLSMLAAIPLVGDMVNEVTALGILDIVAGLDTKADDIYIDTQALVAGQGGGSQELLDAIAAVRGSGAPDIAAVLTAIGALGGGSVPSAAQNADAVWAYVNGATPNPGTYAVSAQLAEAWGVLHEMYWQQALKVNGNPLFTVESPGGSITTLSSQFTAPSPDFADILPGESVVDWLNRTDSAPYTWQYDAASGLAVTYDVPVGENWYAIRCTLRTLADLAGTSSLAPIWPGIAAVTLGTPVPISGDTEVAGPMDGVIVALTTIPPGKGFWSAGSRHAYRYAGYVAFTSDNGDADEQQYLGFDQAVYTPKRLTRATSCLIHCAEGIEGTATPWDIAT